MERKPFHVLIRGSGVYVPQEMKEKETLTAIKRPLRLGAHIIVRVDCTRNMLPASDLFEI